VTHVVPIAGGQLDLLRGQATVDGRAHSLSAIEVAVLSVLWEAHPDPVPEEQLLRQAWGYRTTNTRAVSMGVSRLRAKIERDPKAPSTVITVRSQGYRLAVSEGRSLADAPRPAEPLFGRDVLLARIRGQLAEHAVVELVGPGGVGLSAVARAAAPEAVVVPLRGTRQPEQLLRRLCEAWHIDGTSPEPHLRAALQSGAVLDGAEDLSHEARELLASLVDGATGPLLITTRSPLGLGLVSSVTPLDADASRALVRHARHRSGLPEVDRALLDAVVGEASGFPVGLLLAAPLVELAAEQGLGLADEGGGLREVLRQTLQTVPDDERALLAMASAFALPPSVDALGTAAGLPRPSVLRQLVGLRTRGLVLLDGGRVEVPRAVAAVAVTEEARAAHGRWVATLPCDPMSLRRLRHELEAALPIVSPRVLGHTLLRHLLVLANYGPHLRVREEVLPMLPRVEPPGARDLLRAFALSVCGDDAAAHVAVGVARTCLDAEDPVLWAWGVLLHSVLASTVGADDGPTVDEMLAARDRVDDTATWAALTGHAALHGRDAAESDRLLREAEERTVSLPLVQLSVGFLRLATGRPGRDQVASLVQRLQGVGREALGPERWCTYNLILAEAWMAVDDPEAALVAAREALDGLPPWHHEEAAHRVLRLVGGCLDRPAVLERVVALDPPGVDAAKALAAWWEEGCGPAPVADEGLRAMLVAARSGAPLPTSGGSLPWRKALEALVARRDAD